MEKLQKKNVKFMCHVCYFTFPPNSPSNNLKGKIFFKRLFKNEWFFIYFHMSHDAIPDCSFLFLHTF